MNILLVYAHPAKSSFNFALRERAANMLQKNNHELRISDLYAKNFKAEADRNDFSLNRKMPDQYGIQQKMAFEENLFGEDIQEEQNNILWSEGIIFQFPLWWFSMPAILKGFFDRVFAAGFAYDKGKWFNTAPLYGRRAMLAITTQAPQSSFQTNGLNGPLLNHLTPIHHSLHFIGIRTVEPFIAYGVVNEDVQLHEQYLKEYGEKVLAFPNEQLMSMPDIKDYDEKLVLR